MQFQAISRDDAAIPLWDGAYDTTVIKDQGNLWGDPPVPHAETAARIFAENSAAVILDLPCGDGRNLPPLAQGAPMEVFRPVAAACEAAELEGIRVELGRVGWAGRLGRVVQALMGEAEARQLVKELTTAAPEVGVGFDPERTDVLMPPLRAVDDKWFRVTVTGSRPASTTRTSVSPHRDRYDPSR